jgi:hypothetical protein
MATIHLKVLDINIVVQCEDELSDRLITEGYDAFVVPSDLAPELHYSIRPLDDHNHELVFNQSEVIRAVNTYELLYLFEKHITIELQKLRRDLLFIHGAALEHEGKCCLVSGPSGNGKSTFTWAALHHGFNYMSDELVPIDLKSGLANCYPHAVCLKKEPPAPYSLPEQTLYTEYTMHVPTSALSCKTVVEPVPLKAIFFVRYDPESAQPAVQPISTAAASAHIYHNALNLLAHERYGLDAAIKVASLCETFELITNDLQRSCQLVIDTIH